MRVVVLKTCDGWSSCKDEETWKGRDYWRASLGRGYTSWWHKVINEKTYMAASINQLIESRAILCVLVGTLSYSNDMQQQPQVKLSRPTYLPRGSYTSSNSFTKQWPS